MKNPTVLLLLFILTFAAGFAQTGNVGIGTSTPNSSSILDVTSTTKGFLPPRMTTTQRDAISAGMNTTQMQGIQGLTIFNTTTGCLETFIGTNAVQSKNWQPIGCGCTSAPSIPSSISGTLQLCQGTSGVAYSIGAIVGATSYTWTIPGTTGSIVTGNGGTSVTINFPSNAVSGNLSVYASNSCGNSTAYNQAITVNPNPTLSGAAQAATVCEGSTATINLTGLIASSTSTVSYSINGSAQTPVTGVVANGSGAATFTTPVLTAANDGQTLQITDIARTDLAVSCSNSFTTNVILDVNPVPTLSGASQSATVCAGSVAQINLTGLIPSSTSTINYKINGVAQTAVTGVVANGSGNASFNSAALTAANNGQILQITSVSRTDVSPVCSTTFTTNVTLSVNPAPTLSGAAQAATVCPGSSATINLTGLIAGSTSTINYKINGVAQTAVTGVVANGSGAASFSTAALTAANNGQTLQITGVTRTDNSPNCTTAFTTNVTMSVNPTPTLSAASQAATVCAGSTATINLTGLIASSTSTITYTINGGATQTVTGVVANGSGAASFTSISLSIGNNGQTLQITGVTRTDNTPNCSATFAVNATLSVTTTTNDFSHTYNSFTIANNGLAGNNWTVPCGITSIKVVVTGAGGGTGWNSLTGTTIGTPGKGAIVNCTLAVTPGEVLAINVGGKGGSLTTNSASANSAGGANGGGLGNYAYPNTMEGGGGGGQSDISVSGSKIVIAGGGGGSCGEPLTCSTSSSALNGGNGGMTGSAGGSNSTCSSGGGGATSGSGGSGGTACYCSPTCSNIITNGLAGSANTGGRGGYDNTSQNGSTCFYAAGGGGGAGYNGGGGGAGGGGGGGSCYPISTTNTSYTYSSTSYGITAITFSVAGSSADGSVSIQY